ncbi:hypothetical protein PRIPAC_79719 [Pristionchus pacificus]|uniref:G protein-coupled receptor n=1 Tax=Pristionchus pacificus TaxID=54126 RepID=A0A2A6CPB1_PRIPA|nr:hypothetical protein PRIPAC_79719 [Pristionchus pacificus]|eukprot:PDM79938.1 G protein-coupled receptor [Pristionchus pacificus]
MVKFTYKPVYNTCHILIAACAFSDILHLLGQILEIVQALAGIGRISSKMCCLAQIIPSFGLSAGTILVLLIAIDRLLSVYLPMFYSTKNTRRYLILHGMAIVVYALAQYAFAYVHFVERQVFCNTPAMYQGKSSDLFGMTSLASFLLSVVVYYAVWRKLRNTAIIISERRLFRSIFSIMGMIIVGWLLTMSVFAVLKMNFDMQAGDSEIILTQIAGLPANITFSLNCPVLGIPETIESHAMHQANVSKQETIEFVFGNNGKKTMKLIIALALCAVAAFALPVDFTIPPLSDEQKAAINTAVEKKLAELPQAQQDAAHELLGKIKKAAEENPEAFKAAIVKAFNNIPESAKQQLIKLKAAQ